MPNVSFQPNFTPTEPRFTPEMYEGIENDSPKEVVAAVRFFMNGIPGFRQQMVHDPQKCQEIIDAIWKRLAVAMKKHDITPPQVSGLK